MAEVLAEKKQNVTVSLSRGTLQSARVLAAKRGTSISGLLAELLEKLVEEDEVYELAKQEAMALMKKGFPLGYSKIDRDALHER